MDDADEVVDTISGVVFGNDDDDVNALPVAATVEGTSFDAVVATSFVSVTAGVTAAAADTVAGGVTVAAAGWVVINGVPSALANDARVTITVFFALPSVTRSVLSSTTDSIVP